ncbi:MAG: hupS [Bacteroidetes bacterium]|nr:hupS [Bacteroidota bacterium]
MALTHAVTRRDFVRWALATPAAAATIESFLPQLASAIEEAVKEYPLIWLQASTCSGCSVSVINTIHPSIKNVILEQVLPGHRLILGYHGTLMAATGDLSLQAARDIARVHKGKYVLIVEGAIPTRDGGIDGTIGESDGKPQTMLQWTKDFGTDALATLAVGTCAAFGGIPAAAPNPTASKSVSEVFQSLNIGTPVINIPGCPSHPDWFIGTVAKILLYGLPKPTELDEQKRLKLFFGRSVHSRCHNRDYLDEGIFAEEFGKEGCLLELGCKGPFTNADCPVRLWNGSVSY